jgi:tetratricopeptide (TPR) repeat protein
MKHGFILLTAVLLAMGLIAQKKPATPSAPPATDINKMADQAIKESGATPEEAAEIKKMMGNIKTASKSPTENLPVAMNGIYPRKDVQRIQEASRIILASPAQLASYLNNLRQALTVKLSPSVSKAGAALLAQFPASYQTGRHLANAAAGCWMAGYPQLGLWIAAQAAVKDPANSNTLNVYSAMLIMLGAEQHAIPMLNRLHAQYPANYSVLNNLGQAWYGLGDFAKAMPMLDSAIIRFPGCAQAYQARAMIKDAAGDKTGSIADLKAAIKAAYTQERLRKLKEKGTDVTTNDLAFRPPAPPDPMGLEKLTLPAYPHNRGEVAELAPKWEYFKNSLDDLKERLETGRATAEEAVQSLNETRMEMMGRGLNQSEVNAAGYALPFATKAWTYKQPVIERMAKGLAVGTEAWRNKISWMEAQVNEIGEQRDKTVRDGIGACACKEVHEGDCVDRECACQLINKAADAFLDKANAVLEAANNEILTYNKKLINDDAYYTQYTLSEAEFALYKIDLKLKYVSLLQNIAPDFTMGSGVPVPMVGSCNGDLPTGAGRGLLDFDSLKCPIENTFWVPGIGSITLRCNQMTTELAPIFLNVKAKYTENWWTGQVSNASFGFEVDVTKAVTVGVSVEGNFDQNGFVNGNVKVEGEVGLIGAGDHESGSPVQVGVSGAVGVTIEIDQNGISDVNVSGDVKAGAELETEGPKSLGKNTPGITLEGSWGVNAGPGLDGKGTLGGMTVVQP